MMRLMRDAWRLYGRRRSSASVGGSVPSARAPIVSMMRLTHSIMTAFRGGSYPLTALRKVSVSATTGGVETGGRDGGTREGGRG